VICFSVGGKVNLGLTGFPLSSIDAAIIIDSSGPLSSTGGRGFDPREQAPPFSSSATSVTKNPTRHACFENRRLIAEIDPPDQDPSKSQTSLARFL
jgi:hypothetical protein